MLQLLYHNALIRFAFVLFVFGMIFILIVLPVEVGVLWLKILFGTVAFLIILAFIQEIVYIRSSKGKYLDLALLLIKTRELENILGFFGAEGKGLYEKANDLFNEDEAFLDEVLYIATARNEAMHGDAKINNIAELLKSTKRIKRFLMSHVLLSIRLYYYLSNIVVILYPFYLTFVLYFFNVTHSIGKLLASVSLLYIFNKIVRLKIGQRNYLIVVLLTFIYTVLIMYENGQYWYLFVDGVKNVF